MIAIVMKKSRTHPWVLLMIFGLVATARGAYLETDVDIPEKPNIIVILSDDHGYGDLSSTEYDTGAVTPHLDRLAREGIRFTQGYATSPICTPSRIGLVLGAYQQRWNNWWYGGPGLPGPEVPTIAEVLREAGYRTAMIGKIHFAGEFGPSARNHPLQHGFDRFYGFNDPAKHYLIHSVEAERVFLEKLMRHDPDQRGYQMMFVGPMWKDDKQVDQKGFSTHLFRDRAIEFVENHADDPFFMLLSFNAIHDQTYQLPPEYLEAEGIPQPRDWDPSVETLEEWSADTYSDDVDRGYLLGQLAYLDQAIGDLLDHLEKSGLRDDTVVIYLSDNGGSTGTAARNDPLRGGKFNMCEGGNRVPFIISWPGVFREGVVLDNVISAMDIFPTSAALAGADIPETVDGINLVPLLTGEQRALEHRTLVWDTGVRRLQWAVRDGDWKLYFSVPSKRTNHDVQGVGYRLTNLRLDPNESENVILEHPQKAAELEAIHREWLEEMLSGGG